MDERLHYYAMLHTYLVTCYSHDELKSHVAVKIGFVGDLGESSLLALEILKYCEAHDAMECLFNILMEEYQAIALRAYRHIDLLLHAIEAYCSLQSPPRYVFPLSSLINMIRQALKAQGPPPRKVIRIVVASPGDVDEERKVVASIVEDLNRFDAKYRGVDFELSRWETDVYPAFHPVGPQGNIDPALRIDSSDLFIGIFWMHFGTPQTDADSGTEHEFNIAQRSWRETGRPQIMFYFNFRDPGRMLSAEETEQWAKVKSFRENYPREGLWWSYDGVEQFRELLRNHLREYLQDIAPL